ncbi:hypothetical protein FKM82_024814 [Ascaphus truei]
MNFCTRAKCMSDLSKKSLKPSTPFSKTNKMEVLCSAPVSESLRLANIYVTLQGEIFHLICTWMWNIKLRNLDSPLAKSFKLYGAKNEENLKFRRCCENMCKWVNFLYNPGATVWGKKGLKKMVSHTFCL